SSQSGNSGESHYGPILIFSCPKPLAFLVEFSQLYHASWIDSIRRTTLGGLVLGFGFLWSDLVCYGIGITLGVVAEWTIGKNAVDSGARICD
ncbi:MAG: DUF2809 domain-containing protein, partial [Planctomycetales bacterium]|nr:DUF2809 domain-containing protein [Planctomycetales bacterium]